MPQEGNLGFIEPLGTPPCKRSKLGLWSASSCSLSEPFLGTSRHHPLVPQGSSGFTSGAQSVRSGVLANQRQLLALWAEAAWRM